MHGAVADVIALILLVAALAFAVARPRGLTEAVVAVPAAALLVVVDIEPAHTARHVLLEIGPTVGFLAAILLFGHLCADAGVFDFLANRAARASRGDAQRLLLRTVVLAALVTATLTLDATVVLLTPVIIGTVRRMHVPASPYTYVCLRLANGGSLLFPVSNLTNLLAVGAAGLSFGRFTALMALPWVLVCVLTWVEMRVLFRRELRAPARDVEDVVAPPRYALVVFAITVVLFVVTSAVHVAPAWAALTGCAALLVPRLIRRDTRRTVRFASLLGAASPGFCAFVLALAVVVDAVTRHGVGSLLKDVMPSGSSLLAVLGAAFVAAVLANVVNNLPATLALLPAVAGQPALVLAVLLGVNLGPNVAYPGSLATLLWRRLVPRDMRPAAGQFHRIGLLSVPPVLALACVALWLGTLAIGV